MDSATRNFLALVSVCALLGAWALWGFFAYVLIPLLGISGGADRRLAAACVLPAIVLAALLAVSVGSAVRTLRRQMSASRRLSRRIRAAELSPGTELAAAVTLTGLDGRVALVDAEEPFSFVYGALVPRVAISRGFLESLTAEELRAALEHERYHVRNLDPLRALTGKVLSEAFFLLPALEVLRDRYQLARELAADRRAEQACGDRPLLGALLKAMEGAQEEPVASASLAQACHLDARISRLESGRMPALAVAGPSSLAWSALGASAFLLVFLSAIVGLGGTSALARAAAYELSARGIFLDSLCAMPIVVVALAYRRLARRAGRPLPQEGLL
jgi:Zn-dependent protease with chaperone function